MIKENLIFFSPCYDPVNKNKVFQDGNNFFKAFAEAQVHISFLLMVALLLLILLYENEFEPVYENKDEIETYFKKIGQIKGQLISKCLFGVSTFFQKTNKNELTSCNGKVVCSFFGRNVSLKNIFEPNCALCNDEICQLISSQDFWRF